MVVDLNSITTHILSYLEKHDLPPFRKLIDWYFGTLCHKLKCLSSNFNFCKYQSLHLHFLTPINGIETLDLENLPYQAPFSTYHLMPREKTSE